jgi:hypothetical protein
LWRHGNRECRLVHQSASLGLKRSAISIAAMALFNEGLIEPEDPAGITDTCKTAIP